MSLPLLIKEYLENISEENIRLLYVNIGYIYLKPKKIL